ncbi:MAG: hypothetical protein LBQ38_10010 [Spirochaetaceae bacterium]|jgi:hypothetical protein|nr:hypothetical protein [Spirochaetaceae bacterium]
MDELFDSLFGLVPVALFVGYWILAIRRGIVNRRKQQAAAEGQLRESSGGAEKAGSPDDEHEAHFSAWDLPVSPEEEAPARPVPEKSPRERSGGIAFPTLQEYLKAKPENPVPAPVAEREKPKPVPAGKQAHGERAFPERLNRLPPLKRAVVWAEILGPPKGR